MSIKEMSVARREGLMMLCKLTSVIATLPLVHGHHVGVQLCALSGRLSGAEREEFDELRYFPTGNKLALQTENWRRFLTEDHTKLCD